MLFTLCLTGETKQEQSFSAFVIPSLVLLGLNLRLAKPRGEDHLARGLGRAGLPRQKSPARVLAVPPVLGCERSVKIE